MKSIFAKSFAGNLRGRLFSVTVMVGLIFVGMSSMAGRALDDLYKAINAGAKVDFIAEASLTSPTRYRGATVIEQDGEGNSVLFVTRKPGDLNLGYGLLTRSEFKAFAAKRFKNNKQQKFTFILGGGDRRTIAGEFDLQEDENRFVIKNIAGIGASEVGLGGLKLGRKGYIVLQGGSWSPIGIQRGL